MKITAWSGDWLTADADLLLLFVMEKQNPLKGLNQASRGLERVLGRAMDQGEFEGKLFETFVIPNPSGMKSRRLALMGLGARDRFRLETLRRAAGTAARTFNKKGIQRLALVSPPGINVEQACDAMAQGLVTGAMEADAYVSPDKKTVRHIKEALLLVPGAKTGDAGRGIRLGTILGESMNFARELVNEPGNILTPSVLADHAVGWAREWGMESRIFGPGEMKKKNMNSLLSVSLGSRQEPRLIRLEYVNPKAPKKAPVLGLVGKGITFDSGGISLKDSKGMEEMKGDMAGAAAVIAAMGAIARLQPRVRVLGIIAAAENMPGGGAQRPGDVWTAMNGKSIEVINTDAEGRLILADALHYAVTQGAGRLVDIATLTGACIVALGHVRAGLMGNDEEWLRALEAAGEISGDRLWRMPMDDEYFEPLKSEIADLRNVGPNPAGGTITAGQFLKQFVGKTTWAHVDIAAVAWNDKPQPFMAGFGAGFGVRLLTRLAMDLG